MKSIYFVVTLCLAGAVNPLPAQNTSAYQYFADGAAASASAAEGFAKSAQTSADSARDSWGQAGSPTSGPCFDAAKDASLAAKIAKAQADYARDQANLAKDNASKAEAARKRLDELARIEARGGLSEEQKQEKERLEHEHDFNVRMLFIHGNRAADGAEGARDSAAEALDAQRKAAKNC